MSSLSIRVEVNPIWTIIDQSLYCQQSKKLERHVNKHLMTYLNKYSLIHNSQSGFRQKHSCQTALIKLIDKCISCIDQGYMIASLLIDFRKAFDLVDHNILNEKLPAYKCSSLTLKWFKSYLKSRQQTVQSDWGLSASANIKSGIPEGSILGPTLFLLFISDIPFLLTVHDNSPDIDELNENMLIDFFKIVGWSKQNKLPINFNKSIYMILNAKRCIQDPYAPIEHRWWKNW